MKIKTFKKPVFLVSYACGRRQHVRAIATVHRVSWYCVPYMWQAVYFIYCVRYFMVLVYVLYLIMMMYTISYTLWREVGKQIAVLHRPNSW